MALTVDFQGQNNGISGIGGPIDIGKDRIHDHERELLVTKVRCNDLPDSDQGDFRGQENVHGNVIRKMATICICGG